MGPCFPPCSPAVNQGWIFEHLGKHLLLLAAMVSAVRSLTFLEDGHDGRDACKAPC